MNHRDIEAGALIERYVNRTLPAALAGALEEHLVGCAECLEQLTWTERLQQGLRASVTEASMPQPAAVRASLRRSSPAWAAAAALACVSLAAGLMARREAGLADEQRAAAAAWQARYAQERAAGQQVSAGVPLLALGVVRGSGGGPEPVLELRPGDAWAVVSLEFEPDAAFASYAARLCAADGHELWQADGLRPASWPFTLVLPTRGLGGGHYALTVWGVAPNGRREAVATSPFILRLAQPK